METSFVVSQLQTNRSTFDSFLRDAPEAVQRWRPHPEHWCLLEIVCHLCDEERDDFRARVRSVLEDPERPLPPIDPQGWVDERRYLEQDFAAKLDAFLEERKASVRWLNGLADPAWENSYQHPKLGPLTARMFLASWLAHDYLHIRQIAKVKFLFLQANAGVSVDYAGKW